MVITATATTKRITNSIQSSQPLRRSRHTILPPPSPHCNPTPSSTMGNLLSRILLQRRPTILHQGVHRCRTGITNQSRKWDQSTITTGLWTTFGQWGMVSCLSRGGCLAMEGVGCTESFAGGECFGECFGFCGRSDEECCNEQ